MAQLRPYSPAGLLRANGDAVRVCLRWSSSTWRIHSVLSRRVTFALFGRCGGNMVSRRASGLSLGRWTDVLQARGMFALRVECFANTDDDGRTRVSQLRPTDYIAYDVPMLFTGCFPLPFVACLLAAVAGSFCPVRAADSDDGVTITSIAGGRSALRDLIWGTAGFPGRAQPSSHLIEHSDPEWNRVVSEMGLTGFSGLDRIEELTFSLPAGPAATGYLFPAKDDLHRLVIVYQGHGCEFGPPGAGLQSLVRTLLGNGYSVAALYMPRPSNCVSKGMVAFHREVFADFPKSLPGSPLQAFLDPAAQTVNYALQKGGYRRVDMIGLSGGGWTVTAYAAVDPRIQLSIPVAGTRPRSVPGTCGLNVNDPEQAAIPNYYNLYVLGSVGAGRRQIQILNKYDSCCFQVICKGENLEPEIRQYEKVVQRADQKFGGGNFRVYIDEDSHAHQVSPNAVQQVILRALKESR